MQNQNQDSTKHQCGGCEKIYNAKHQLLLHQKLKKCGIFPTDVLIQQRPQITYLQIDYSCFKQLQSVNKKQKFRQWVKQSSTQESHQYFQRIANYYLFQKEYQSALDYYFSALDKIQNTSDAEYYGILIQYMMDRFIGDKWDEGLVEVYFKLIGISPKLYTICTGIGLVVRKLLSSSQSKGHFQNFRDKMKKEIDKLQESKIYRCLMNITADAFYYMHKIYAKQKKDNKYLQKSFKYYSQNLKEITGLGYSMIQLNSKFGEYNYRLIKGELKTNQSIVNAINITNLQQDENIKNCLKQYLNNHKLETPIQTTNAGFIIKCIKKLQASKLKNRQNFIRQVQASQLPDDKQEIKKQHQTDKIIVCYLKSLKNTDDIKKIFSFGIIVEFVTLCIRYRQFIAEAIELIERYKKIFQNAYQFTQRKKYELKIKLCQCFQILDDKVSQYQQLNSIQNHFDHRAYFLLGILNYQLEAYDTAILNFQESLKKNKAHSVKIENKLFKNIAKCYSKKSESILLQIKADAQEFSLDSHKQRISQKQKILMEQKHHDLFNKAQKYFQKAFVNRRSQFRLGQLYCERGKHYQRNFDIIKAKQYYLLGKEQLSKQSYLNYILITPEDCGTKSQQLIKLIELYPHYQLAYHELSLQFIKKKLLRSAQQLFQKLQLNKGQIQDIAILNNYARVLFQLSTEDQNQAQRNKKRERSKKLLQKCIKKQKNIIKLLQQSKSEAKKKQKQQLQLCLFQINKFSIIQQMTTDRKKIEYSQILQSVKKCNQILSRYQDQNPYTNLNYYDYLLKKMKVFQQRKTFHPITDDLKEQISKLCRDFFRNNPLETPLNNKVHQKRDDKLIKIFQLLYEQRDNIFMPSNQEETVQNIFVPFVDQIKWLFIHVHPGFFQILPLVFFCYFCRNLKQRRQHCKQQDINVLVKNIDDQIANFAKILHKHKKFSQRNFQCSFKCDHSEEEITLNERIKNKKNCIQFLEKNDSYFQRQENQEKFSKNVNLFKLTKPENICSVKDLNSEILKILNSTNAQYQLSQFMRQINSNQKACIKVDVMSNYSRLARVLEKMLKSYLQNKIFDVFSKKIMNKEKFEVVQIQNELYNSLDEQVQIILSNLDLRKKIRCQISDFVRSMHHVSKLSQLQQSIQLIIKKCQQKKDKWSIITAEDNRKDPQCKNYVFKLLYKEKQKYMVCQLQISPQFHSTHEKMQYQFGHNLFEIIRSKNLGSLFGCFMNLSKNYDKASQRIQITSLIQRLLKKLKQSNGNQNKIEALQWFQNQLSP